MDGVKVARTAARQVNELRPLVQNAARVLALAQSSFSDGAGAIARQAMAEYGAHWSDAQTVLGRALEALLPPLELLLVGEARTALDVHSALAAIEERAPERLRALTRALRSRVLRLTDLVGDELESSPRGAPPDFIVFEFGLNVNLQTSRYFCQ